MRNCAQLTDNLSKGIDTLLLGPISVGKSHLLALLNAENVLVEKPLTPAKESLINIAKELHKPETQKRAIQGYVANSSNSKPAVSGQQSAKQAINNAVALVRMGGG